VVARLGLIWNEEARHVFDESRIKNISTEAEQAEFAMRYPYAHEAFRNLGDNIRLGQVKIDKH